MISMLRYLSKGQRSLHTKRWKCEHRDGNQERTKRNVRDLKPKQTQIVTGMKNAFLTDLLYSRYDMAEERVSELEAVSVETSKTEKQTEELNKNRTEYPSGCNYRRHNIYIMGIPEGEEKKEQSKYLQQ